MGSAISIDKFVSALDDILRVNTKYFADVKFDSKKGIPGSVIQHIKALPRIWDFHYSFYGEIGLAFLPLLRLHSIRANRLTRHQELQLHVETRRKLSHPSDFQNEAHLYFPIGDLFLTLFVSWSSR